jgi:hypothetical protein
MHQVSSWQPGEPFTPYGLTVWDPDGLVIFSQPIQLIGTVHVSSLVGDEPIGGFRIESEAGGNWMRISQLTYDLELRVVDAVQLVSIADDDGFIREASEDSDVGGLAKAGNTGEASLRAGDNATRRQLKAVVSFDTSALPAGVGITRATLNLTRGTTLGDPLATLGDLYGDVQTGGLGASRALEASDFEAPAAAPRALRLAVDSASAFGDLDAEGISAIDPSGVTQIRLEFEFDDDDDSSKDYLGFYSGDSAEPASHPVLEVEYESWVPRGG